MSTPRFAVGDRILLHHEGNRRTLPDTPLTVTKIGRVWGEATYDEPYRPPVKFHIVTGYVEERRDHHSYLSVTTEAMRAEKIRHDELRAALSAGGVDVAPLVYLRDQERHLPVATLERLLAALTEER